MLDRAGFDELRRRLSGLRSGAVRILRAGLRTKQKIEAEAMSAASLRAPSARTVKGVVIQPGGAAASVGFSLGRTSADGSVPGKTGLGVGKKKVPLDQQVIKGGKNAVGYGHLGVLGTETRTTGYKKVSKGRNGKRVVRTGNAVLNRGRVGPHPTLVPAAESVQGAANSAMFKVIENGIAKEWARDV